MIVFPLAAAGVSALFSVSLLRRWSRKRRFPELAWGLALGQYALASLAVAWGVGQGWGPTSYRVFWIFGALLNVPFLALGSIALLGRRSLTILSILAVVAGTLFAVGKTIAGDLNPAIAAVEGIPRGSLAWTNDGSVRALASLYSIPAWLVVVLIAVLSGVPRRGVRPPASRVRANWTIAAGVSIVAVGSFALSRLARGSAFSVTLALGVTVMFAGFARLGSRRPPDDAVHA